MTGRRAVMASAAALAAALVAGVAAAGPSGAQASPWVRVTPPADVRPQATLTGVTALAPGRAWAVGQEYQGVSGAPVGVPLVLQLTGRRWSKMPLPDITWNGVLDSVAAVGPRDVWATGRECRREWTCPVHVLHYDGTAWRDVPFPGAGTRRDRLRVVAAPGRPPWIVNDTPLRVDVLMRWTGTEWVDVALPPVEHVQAVHVTRDGTVWLGAYSFTETSPRQLRLQVFRRSGADWVPLPEGPGMYPNSILAGPGGRLWVAGTLPSSGPLPLPIVTTLATWDGTSWRTVDLPRTQGTPRLSGDDAGRPEWLAGTIQLSEDGQSATGGYLKYTGGTWTRVPHAPGVPPEQDIAELYDIAHVPGTTSTLAVGQVAYPEYGQYVPRIEREDSP